MLLTLAISFLTENEVVSFQLAMLLINMSIKEWGGMYLVVMIKSYDEGEGGILVICQSKNRGEMYLVVMIKVMMKGKVEFL
jgi:hypothetical protein